MPHTQASPHGKPAPQYGRPDRACAKSGQQRASDSAQIRALLASRIDELVQRLCPGAPVERSGAYLFPLNPTRNDDKPGSFWVVCHGEATGAWRDEATGDKGDIVDLVRYCLGLPANQAGWGEAFKWARDFLGIENLTPEQRQRMAAMAAPKRVKPPEDAAREIAGQRAAARGMWLSGGLIKGTVVERYLLARGIDCRKLKTWPDALRVIGAMRHAETGTQWPVMIAPLSVYAADGAHTWVGVHRTWLAEDGSGKAPVAPAKKIWPRGWQGGVITLARGENGLPVKEAIKAGVLETLCLCEGIEDGLTLALARPDWRVWAVGTLGNLAHVAVPPCCDRVVVAADNDWGKRQARAAFDAGIDALARQGAAVSVVRAGGGAKDFNDQLRG